MSTDTSTPPVAQEEQKRPFLLTGAGWPYLLVPLIPVAVVAVARAAAEEGLTPVPIDGLVQQIYQEMWRPDYPQIEAVGS